MTPILSDVELERIRQAVHEAEQQTAGEIVPVLMPESGRYEVAYWRAAGLCVVLALTTSVLVHQFYHSWGTLDWLYTGLGTALIVLAAALMGWLLALIPALRRWLIGPALLTQTVHRRAWQAFVQEEVFNTRDRTGILLFISLFEHRIEVLGDAGINARVTPDEWAEVVLTIRNGIRHGHLDDGLVEAIGKCGVLLHKRGVEIKTDDTNELPDTARLRRDG
jgi:putative membrane protein